MECRPASSRQHQRYYEESFTESEDDEEPIYHFVQDTSCDAASSSSYIRQWAANVPYGRAPKSQQQQPRREPSPERVSRTKRVSRPKLITSIGRRPTSTTSSSYHHANPTRSPSSETSTTDYSSIATPPPPPHDLMRKYSPTPIQHSQSHHYRTSPPSDVDPEEQAWWIPHSSSRSHISATPISISNKKSPYAYENTGYHVQPRLVRH